MDDNIVLMCGEEDPKSCHRHNLITQSLVKKGLEVIHIRKNGKINKITKTTQKRRPENPILIKFLRMY